MCKLKSSHLYAIFSLWINNPLKALLYFSVHNDIQHYQIQWVLERLLITRNILGFAIKSIKRDNFHAPLAALGHTYKWWIYVWTGFFSFHTTQPTIQDISALDAVEEFLHLFVNTYEIVLILWFESSSGGHFRRIYFPDLTFWISRTWNILCDRGLVLCHWQDATGKGEMMRRRSLSNPVCVRV